MSTASLRITPIPASPLGVRVELDPTQPLDADAQAALRDAYDEHGLLLFRGHAMTFDEQRRIGAALGPLLENGKYYVSNVHAESMIGKGELEWHSDAGFATEPYLGVGLYGFELDAGQAPTKYVSVRDGCRRVPADLLARVATLDASFTYPLTDGYSGTSNGEPLPPSRRPVVDRHPRTGEPVLTVSRRHTERILDVTPEESDALLEALYAVVYDAAYVYVHHWEHDDLVLWDNRAVQHARGGLGTAGRRTLRRMTLATRSVEEMLPTFHTGSTEVARRTLGQVKTV